MDLAGIVTDGYERKARLYPALLLISPIIATGVALLTAKLSGLQSLLAGLLGCGGAFLLTQLARDAGKKREASLFAKWGRVPSMTIFRHLDTRLDPITKSRYHKILSGLVKEAKAPTPEEERANPAAADSVYTAWSNYLRVNTRDTKKFTLLFKENVSYGYRRNVWGLRVVGILISLLGVLACGAHIYLVHNSLGTIDEASAGAGAFSGIMLALWILRFNSNWVRVPAEEYAKRLAECAEALAENVAAPRAAAKR